MVADHGHIEVRRISHNRLHRGWVAAHTGDYAGMVPTRRWTRSGAILALSEKIRAAKHAVRFF
jgi:hypothetical protein